MIYNQSNNVIFRGSVLLTHPVYARNLKLCTMYFPLCIMYYYVICAILDTLLKVMVPFFLSTIIVGINPHKKGASNGVRKQGVLRLFVSALIEGSLRNMLLLLACFLPPSDPLLFYTGWRPAWRQGVQRLVTYTIIWKHDLAASANFSCGQCLHVEAIYMIKQLIKYIGIQLPKTSKKF